MDLMYLMGDGSGQNTDHPVNSPKTKKKAAKSQDPQKKRSVYDSDSDDDVEMEEYTSATSTDPAVKNDISRQLEQYKQVEDYIASIQQATEEIKRLSNEDNKTSQESKRQSIVRSADQLFASSTKNAKACKELLEALKAENQLFSDNPDNKHSAREQMRENLYLTNAKKFQAVMSDFSTARERFRENITARMVRQTKIVDGGRHSDDQIKELVDNGQVEDIIGKALHSERIESIIDDLRSRNAEILKLQRSVQELFELFKDLHTLVQLQGETLNVVENRILTAVDYTEKGVKNLEEAKEHSKKARKCKCIALAVLVVILLGVSIPLIIKYGTNM